MAGIAEAAAGRPTIASRSVAPRAAVIALITGVTGRHGNYVGNLDALRDWGHARDYVEMQWLMLQQPEPEDFVIAAGRQFSVRQFVGIAGRELGIEINLRHPCRDALQTIAFGTRLGQ